MIVPNFIQIWPFMPSLERTKACRTYWHSDTLTHTRTHTHTHTHIARVLAQLRLRIHKKFDDVKGYWTGDKILTGNRVETVVCCLTCLFETRFLHVICIEPLIINLQKQPLEVFHKKVVLKKIAIFTWKHLSRESLFNKVAGLLAWNLIKYKLQD